MNTLTASFGQFIREHDDVPAFHAAYLLLTFLAALLFNLGIFGLLVAGHMTLDVIKYRDVHGYTRFQTIQATFIESLMDIMLLALGTFFAVYLHGGSGVVAISGLLEMEGVLARLLGIVIPRMGILSHLFGVFANVRAHVREATVQKTLRLRSGQRVCLYTIALSLGLVALSPLLLPFSTETIVHILMEEWVPWRI